MNVFDVVELAAVGVAGVGAAAYGVQKLKRRPAPAAVTPTIPPPPLQSSRYAHLTEGLRKK
jgi:hypothetical protein